LINFFAERLHRYGNECVFGTIGRKDSRNSFKIVALQLKRPNKCLPKLFFNKYYEQARIVLQMANYRKKPKDLLAALYTFEIVKKNLSR